jgi:hypothetical protein
MFFPLTGVSMYIIPDDVIYDPPRLLSFLAEYRITRMLFTPSLLQAVLDFKGLQPNKAFQFMRCVFITNTWECGCSEAMMYHIHMKFL